MFASTTSSQLAVQWSMGLPPQQGLITKALYVRNAVWFSFDIPLHNYQHDMAI